MRTEKGGKYARADQTLKVAIIDADQQSRRIHEAVGCRAYAIFESRGSVAGHELEDWQQAEGELVSSLCCGRMTVGDSLWVEADAAIFVRDTIEIWVASRKITICGKPRMDRVNSHRKDSELRRGGEKIFRVLDLPVEVDPCHVSVKFNGPSLELLLRKAGGKQQKARAVVA